MVLRISCLTVSRTSVVTGVYGMCRSMSDMTVMPLVYGVCDMAEKNDIN